MQAYLLVIEVEPVSVGGDYPMLPLHCTLVHWFWASTNPAEFERLLADALRSFRPQKLIIGEEAVFTGHTRQGPVPVTVNKVTRTPSLRRLHIKMCDLLDSLGVRYSAPQYARDGFNPHITHQAGAKLAPGSSCLSSAVYLVRAAAPEYGNVRHIAARFDLKGGKGGLPA